jgi:hypothetical protein
VVRHEDRVGAVVEAPAGVIRPKDPLHDHREPGEIFQPRDRRRIEGGILLESLVIPSAGALGRGAFEFREMHVELSR